MRFTYLGACWFSTSNNRFLRRTRSPKAGSSAPDGRQCCCRVVVVVVVVVVLVVCCVGILNTCTS